MTRVALESLGCKLNQAETESLAWQFVKRGYELAESAAEADVYVLNTCTVTHVADRKTRHLLRSVRRSNPGAIIVATGCYAQRAPEELRQLGAVDLILGRVAKDRLPEVLEGDDRLKILPWEKAQRSQPSRTRSLVKVQEGCSSFCSFCIVPYTRSGEHSVPLDEVIQDIKERVAAGYQEVVLTGTKIGAYRWDGLAHASLPYLVEQVLQRTGVKRLRLSSLQPQEVTPEVAGLWANDRLCPHLHMPLQSGSHIVLQRMKRGYSIHQYEKVMALLRHAVPNLAVTTDIIVGFPGETDEEFQESYRFCEKMGFANIHVFPYSPRLGTEAAIMPGQVEESTKRDRSQRMLALAKQSARRYRQQFLGRTMGVLWESQVEGSRWSGLTPNYLRVFVRGDEHLTNRLLETKLTGECAEGLIGELPTGGR